MVFVLRSINIAYYITWFSDLKLTLHSWDKPTWGWYIIPLIFCWISFASILLRTGPVISKYRLNRMLPNSVLSVSSGVMLYKRWDFQHSHCQEQGIVDWTQWTLIECMNDSTNILNEQLDYLELMTILVWMRAMYYFYSFFFKNCMLLWLYCLKGGVWIY